MPSSSNRFFSAASPLAAARLLVLCIAGALLPVFGQAALETDARPLAPGDVIRVTMLEDADVAFEGEISIAGTIPLRYLREVAVSGLTTVQAEQRIIAALTETLYRKATVSVALLRRAAGKIYVYGAVKRPGVLELPPTGQVTIMQLVSEMGGLTSWADPEKAYIIRQRDEGEPERIPTDLTRLFSDTSRQIYVPLQPGDIFFVPGVDGSTQQAMTTDASEIIVVGEVNNPGIILFAPGEQRTVMRAIFKAAGFTKFAKSKEVNLIRYGKDGSRTDQKINVSAVIDDGFLDQDVALLPGDMLIVPQKMINF